MTTPWIWRAGRRSPRGHHARHRVLETVHLLGRELEQTRALGLSLHDLRPDDGAVGCERGVEPRHVDDGLRVLALADREAQQ